MSPGELPPVVDAATAPHRAWGIGCDAWALLDLDDLCVIEERMPPGASEVAHHHVYARQFFLVLEGGIAIDLDAERLELCVGQRVCIEPGVVHTVENSAAVPARFLAIASPSTAGDRVDRDEPT